MDIFMGYIQPLLAIVTIASLVWLVLNLTLKSKKPSENFYKFFAFSLIIQFIAIFFGSSGIMLFIITIGIILFYTEGFDEKFIERSERD